MVGRSHFINKQKKEKAKAFCNKKQKPRPKAAKDMTKPIVTAAEKKANATRYCTSPRPRHNAALKASSERDFASLVKTCMKTKMSKARAIEHATTVINAQADLYTNAAGGPAQACFWGYSPTSPRPSL